LTGATVENPPSSWHNGDGCTFVDLDALLPHSPALVAMLFLLMCSAFFSFSEAAMFSLRQTERRALAENGKLGNLVLRLLENPERLLTSILLGNLFANLLFFTLASIIALKLEKQEQSGLAWGIGTGSLLVIIIFAEILPKNVSVMLPRFSSMLVCLPLSLLVRTLQPILPTLSFLNLLSRRLISPNFEPEPYLRVGDLERAVALSGDDATLLKREQRSLQNIVSLSDMEAAELMRPRSWLKTFHPPITFEQVLTEMNGTIPLSGYCLLTEPDSDEIVSALSLTRLTADSLETTWDEHFENVLYVPWSTSVAEVFDRLQQTDRNVAVVINEFGETVGIITMDDIIATLFTRDQERSRRLLNRRELKRIAENRWQLTGLTSLRTLERKFNVSFRQYASLTVSGLLREILERLPRTGDECHVNALKFQVISIEEDDDLVVLLTCE
jgi:CBS domain containing-hemolysin-like protein